MNINRFLENSWRTDVIGRNIYTRGMELDRKYGASEDRPYTKWCEPAFGLNGAAAIAHQIDVCDILVPEIFENGAKREFRSMRNRWTPAYMETYYRSAPDKDYYERTGTLCVKEKKGFLPGDTFFAELTLYNDKREDTEINVKLCSPFQKHGDIFYDVKAKVMPRALVDWYTVDGVGCAKFDGGADEVTVKVPGGQSVKLKYAFAYDAADKDKCFTAVENALKCADPFNKMESAFNSWMAEHIPVLTTDDNDILKVYYYRAFLVYHAIHTPKKLIPDHKYEGACVYESPFGSYFGAPVGLSIPLQIEEMKWLDLGDVIHSQLENWKKALGKTQRYIQFTPLAVWHQYLHDGDKDFLCTMFDECKAYVAQKYDVKTPDCLPLMTGSWMTGAEYQPSFYQYTSPEWDWRHDNERVNDGFEKTSLYRADECIMLAGNLYACGKMAETLGKTDDAALYDKCSKTVIKKMKELMWDEERGTFVDAYEDGRRCDKAIGYDSVAPLMWGLAGKKYDKAFDFLFSDLFAADFPMPTVEKDCPMYWFDNCVAGPAASSTNDPHYYDCSWNGPTWPFADTVVLEALGNAALNNAALRPKFIELFGRFTELHFMYGDRTVPMIAEHYRSTDGVTFSPYVDYFHSEWLSLFFAYWAGISVSEDGVGFSPITKSDFTIENVTVRGKKYRFTQKTENGHTIFKASIM